MDPCHTLGTYGTKKLQMNHKKSQFSTKVGKIWFGQSEPPEKWSVGTISPPPPWSLSYEKVMGQEGLKYQKHIQNQYSFWSSIGFLVFS